MTYRIRPPTYSTEELQLHPSEIDYVPHDYSPEPGAAVLVRLGKQKYWPARVLCVCGYGQNAIFHLRLEDRGQRLSASVLQLRTRSDPS